MNRNNRGKRIVGIEEIDGVGQKYHSKQAVEKKASILKPSIYEDRQTACDKDNADLDSEQIIADQCDSDKTSVEHFERHNEEVDSYGD